MTAAPTGSTGGVDTDIAISTLAIDFGQVNPGSIAQASVTLTNIGGDPFTVHMAGGAPPNVEFNASQNCVQQTLPSGGSCMVNYSFSPTTAGIFVDFSSFIVGETDDQSLGEQFTVALYGCGIPC